MYGIHKAAVSIKDWKQGEVASFVLSKSNKIHIPTTLKLINTLYLDSIIHRITYCVFM